MTRGEHQTIFPPSPVNGERREWVKYGDPAAVDPGELSRCVGRLGAAVLLARNWPGEGARHEAALAVAGGLLHSGLTTAEAESFMDAVCSVARDSERGKRVATVEDTAKK